MIASFFRNKTVMITILFILVLIGISFFTTNTTPKQYPAFLTESPSPTGTKALYTYLGNSDLTVGKATKLPAKSDNLKENRLLLGPAIFSDTQVNQHYLDYVESGHHLIVGKENPDGLFQIETEVVPELIGGGEKATEIKTATETYQATLKSTFRLIKKENDRILLQDQHGILALSRPMKKGSLTIFLEPSWLMNKEVTNHDHLAIINEILLLQENTALMFDEYSVAMSGGVASVFEVYPNWAYVLLIEGILISLLILWYLGKRFGTVHPVREETVRYSDERLQAIANWHLKGKNYSASLHDQLHYLQDKIQERYGISYKESWPDRISLLEEKTDTFSKKEGERWRKEIAELFRKKTIKKQEYLHWSKLINEIRREVE